MRAVIRFDDRAGNFDEDTDRGRALPGHLNPLLATARMAKHGERSSRDADSLSLTSKGISEMVESSEFSLFGEISCTALHRTLMIDEGQLDIDSVPLSISSAPTLRT